MRVGAIDVGTNSVHLLVADVHPDGTFSVVEKARVQVELGSGGMSKNRLSDEAFERGMAAMRSFADACTSLGVESIHCAATSAVREAENGADWCRAVRQETNIHVRVIPGQEEGKLIYLGARTDLDFNTGRVLLLDLGGGSTEFILCDSEVPRVIQSLPLGHIRLSEEVEHPLSAGDREHLRNRIKSTMKPIKAVVKGKHFNTMVGTSGTMRCLARMATVRRGDPVPAHSHGLLLKRDELDALVEVLATTPIEEISHLPGMDPKRRRTITAGAILVQQVMHTYDKTELVTSERSLRDGLIFDWILKNRPEIELSSSVPDPRERSIRTLQGRYNADPLHAAYVEEFSLNLFDALAQVHRYGFVERGLLGHAARVHDIGHHIAGAAHNLHGQYLVRHSRLHGFTTPEIEMVAMLVRYHRGGKPKVEDRGFGALGEPDRQRIRVLAGILRIADSLDRSHAQPIEDLQVEVGNGLVRVIARTSQEVHLERWAFERRKDLLESALLHEIQFTVVDTSDDDAPNAALR